MRVDLFDFLLPKEHIATHPASPRESARLLHVQQNTLSDIIISDLPSLLKAGDALVLNDTRVIPARLFALKGQARIEILLHKPLSDGRWQVFAKPAKKLKPGDVVEFVMPHSSSATPHSSSVIPHLMRDQQEMPHQVRHDNNFTAKILEKLPSGEVVLAFNRTGEAFMAALGEYGAPPLPPYIERPEGATANDIEDYQTCYAANDGAVAAPTAGLHFTPALLKQIADMDVTLEKVTLHVGAGTFQPVKVEDTDAHIMHSEWGQVSAEVAARLNAVKQRGGRVIAVGTTSLRLLESAADTAGVLHPYLGETAIFITPGYRFRFVDCLMTNFHLPKSTLFMLVSAFAGRERMQNAYKHAIAAGYRFYSYGDACFLEKCDT